MPRLFTNVFGYSSTIAGWIRASPVVHEPPVITALRTIRDIELDEYRTISEVYIAPQTDGGPCGDFLNLVRLPSACVPTSKAITFDISPSGQKTIAFTTGEGKSNYIEVVASENVIKIDAGDLHGKVIGDSWFGSVSWSFDERYVTYVAQPKAVKKTSSFEEDVSNKFDYIEDWGEKMDGLSTLVICILDTHIGKITVLSDLSEGNITVGQPSFNSHSYEIVYTAWITQPKRLGMIYCFQRPCSLYMVSLSDFLTSGTKLVPTQITPNLKLARSGRFSPDGKLLCFIGRKNSLVSHNGCFELFMKRLDSPKSEPECVLRVVDSAVGDLPRDLPTADLMKLVKSLSQEVFPGVFTDQLPKRCFSEDSSSIFFTTQWGLAETVVSYDISSGHITRVPGLTAITSSPSVDGVSLPSCSILDICGDWLLYSSSSPIMPARLGLLQLSTRKVWKSPMHRFHRYFFAFIIYLYIIYIHNIYWH